MNHYTCMKDRHTSTSILCQFSLEPRPPPKKKGGLTTNNYSTSSLHGLAMAMDSAKSYLKSLSLAGLQKIAGCAKQVCNSVMNIAK